MWQSWLVVCGICLVIEILTTSFLGFWFAIGALFSLIVSLFTDNFIIQFAVFIVSSALLTFLTKPFVKKILNVSEKNETNAYSIIGKKAIVTQEINCTTGTGQIKVGSEIWSAKNESEDIISKGSEVEITSIDGVKAIVTLKKNELAQ